MRRLLPILAFTLLGALVLGDVVFAQESGRFARFLGVAYADTRLLVIRILQIIWFFVFAGSLGFLIYGYVLYRRADPEDLYEQPHAKRMMFTSAIAAGASLLLFIILTVAYILIERGYYRKTPPRTAEEIARGLGTQIVIPATSIRDHYPVRDERNVPRDTSILITFADPMQKESILDTTNGVRRDSILIRRSAPTQEGDYAVVTATGVLSVDGTTLKILPTALLGEPDQRILYTIALTQEVKKQDGTPLFTQKEGGYAWQFEVSGLVDTTPPTVETYLPLANSRNPINTLVQVTFSEPIDPFSVTKDSMIVLAGEGGSSVPANGTLTVANGYRTVTFASRTSCGTNQCDQQVYCFATNTAFIGRMKAASLKSSTTPRDNPNKAAFPYNGIVDTAGNSLDGGGLNGQSRNGKSDGKETDDFLWNFSTATEKSTTSPTITTIQPGRDASGVSLTAPVTAQFSTFMDITSLNNATIGFSKPMNVRVSSQHVFSERRTRAQIHHEPLEANTTYTPAVNSGVRDIYQNCYNPCSGPGVQ